MLLLVRRKSIRISIALTILSDLYYQTHEKLVQQDHLEKIAPNGRCGHLSDRRDRDFCDGETREHLQMSSAKNFEIFSLSLHLKHPAHNECADWCLVLSYQVSAQSNKYCRLWIDYKISVGAPQQRLLGKLGKSDSEELCGLMSCIILPSSSLIGWIL